MKNTVQCTLEAKWKNGIWEFTGNKSWKPEVSQENTRPRTALNLISCPTTPKPWTYVRDSGCMFLWNVVSSLLGASIFRFIVTSTSAWHFTVPIAPVQWVSKCLLQIFRFGRGLRGPQCGPSGTLVVWAALWCPWSIPQPGRCPSQCYLEMEAVRCLRSIRWNTPGTGKDHTSLWPPEL